jgi:uracil-xanthine permease
MSDDSVRYAPGIAVPDIQYFPEDTMPAGRAALLGLQHVLAMFGATVLAPILMGFNPNTAILFSGISTLIFMVVVGGKVPSYLGSSFAFIAAVAAASGYSGAGANPNLAVALGGIVAAGALYLVLALLITWIGFRWIEVIFPDLVSGTIVGIIGLSLAAVAVSQVGTAPFGILIGLLTLLVAVLWPVVFRVRKGGSPGTVRGIVAVLPIIAAGVIGYLAYLIGANFLGYGKPIDFGPLHQAPIFGIPAFAAPVFDPVAISIVVPVVIVLLAENLGHVKAIGAMMGRDLNPMVGRAFAGDAIATMVSGFGGGPGMTTYAENMAVMRLTGNFARVTFVAAAIIAIALGFSPIFGALIQTIPVPVLGGLSFALFGLITGAMGTIWQRGIQEGKINFLETRTLLVVGIGLVIGAGNFVIRIGTFELGGIVTATLITVVLYHLLSFFGGASTEVPGGVQ